MEEGRVPFILACQEKIIGEGRVPKILACQEKIIGGEERISKILAF